MLLAMSVSVGTFYKFVALDKPECIRSTLEATCRSHDLKGTILLAGEGVNGTVAGAAHNVKAWVDAVNEDLALSALTPIALRFSTSGKTPFQRLKVRVRPEIVTSGVDVDPTEEVGTYVKPEGWNALISRPDVITIDTRNVYETRIGTFRGAVDPQTETFRDFPEFVDSNLKDKDTPIAMFCTGGIRCEKASALLLQRGFKNVYHLEGGILNYLQQTSPQESLWEGECFVFDDRVAVGHGLEPGDYSICQGCGAPLAPEAKDHVLYEEGICCQWCAEQQTEAQRSGHMERRKQQLLAIARLRRTE